MTRVNIMLWCSPADVMSWAGATCALIGPCRFNRPIGGGGVVGSNRHVPISSDLFQKPARHRWSSRQVPPAKHCDPSRKERRTCRRGLRNVGTSAAAVWLTEGFTRTASKWKSIYDRVCINTQTAPGNDRGERATTSRSQREHAGLLANSHVDPQPVLDRTLEH